MPKSLQEDGVKKVVAELLQCKEKWIAVKLLGRIQKVDEDKIMNRVVRMHGYRCLKAALSNFIDDNNIALQVLDILYRFPRITRNKIQDSGIEDVVAKLKDSDDEQVVEKATTILEEWSKLEVGYRIPRVNRDPNAAVPNATVPRNEWARREVRETKSRSKSPVAPTGPKSHIPQKGHVPQRANGHFGPGRPRAPKPRMRPLPEGWFPAYEKGRVYYYSRTGFVTWDRPVEPAIEANPLAVQMSHEEKLRQIIKNITNSANTPKDSPANSTPKGNKDTPEPKKEEKWRSYSEEKQKKIYENTVMRRFAPF